jgi:hypothetical protein
MKIESGCNSSVYYMVGISVERFIVVCWPLKAASILTPKRTKAIAVGIPVITCVLLIPILVESVGLISGLGTCFMEPYYKLPALIFAFLIPLPCMVLCNITIIWKARKTAIKLMLMNFRNALCNI